MGITRRRLTRLVSVIRTHHRTMAKSPVCLTHESMLNFFTRLQLSPPWIMLQEQQARIKQALQKRKNRLLSEAMTESTPDVCALIPDIWSSDLSMPTDTPDVPQTQEVACPECHRTFKQAWALKRHMRTYHDTPYETEDLFQPLTDAWQGRPVCSHSAHSFVDFYKLCDHINKRACSAFNAAQDSITPIAAREDLRIAPQSGLDG